MTIDDLDSNLDNLPQPAATGGGTAASIGGTLTSGTSGSVLFSGSAVFAQDNTNFFWDNTAKQLELGINAVGSPSYSFKADPNTGMYSSGADTLNWATGGVLGLTLDSTGLLTVRAGVVATSVTNSSLTATRIPVTGTAGLQQDFSTLTFTSGSGTLSATALQATGLTSTRIPFAGASGLLGDSSLLTVASGVVTAAGLTMSAAVNPLSSTITDAGAATQLEVGRFIHHSTINTTGGASAYISLWATNGSGTDREMARIHGLCRTITDAAENGTLLLQTMQSGTVANGGHLQGTNLYGAASIGVGTVSATGVTTNLALIQVVSTMLNVTSSSASNGGLNVTGTVNTSGRRSFFVTTPSANTGITTAVERVTHAFGSTHTNGVADLTSIVQTWANGTVALQRENVWTAPTYLQASGTQVMTVACHHDFGSIPQITGTTNSITGARIARFGGSVAQGVTAAATTYVGIELVPHTITYTGSTQVTSTVGASMMRLDVLTLTDASAVTIDQAATLDIVGAVAAAGSVTLTNPLAIIVRAGTTKLNALLDLSGISAGSPNIKITKTSDAPSTTWTAGASSNAPSGFIEVTEGGTSKYIPFFT
jgi:hypothetical protein